MFARDLNEIEALFSFIRSFGMRHAVQEDLIRSMCLSVEEIFTNILKYNPFGRGLIELDVAIQARRFKVVVTDPDTPYFDPTAQRPLPMPCGLTEQPIGGLGIYLASHSVDKMSYDYHGKEGRVTLIKNLR